MQPVALAEDRSALPYALGALLTPWVVLSLLLPWDWMGLALGLLALLGVLLHLAAAWSSRRADELALSPERWALAAVLTMGGSMLLLLGRTSSGYESLCSSCGRTQDARLAFCGGCGSYF